MCLRLKFDFSISSQYTYILLIICPFLHPIASEWVVANAELTPSNRLVIKNLTTGDLLNIRVVAVNAGGRSEPAPLPQPVVIREVVGECLPHLFYTFLYIPVAQPVVKHSY